MDDLPPPAYDAPRNGRPRRLPSITRGPRAPPSRAQAPTPGSSHSHDGDLSSTASSSSVSESASSEKERLAAYYIANEGPVLESEPASSHVAPPTHTDTTFQPLRPRRRGLATIPEPSTVSLTRGLTLPPAYPPPNLMSPITPCAPVVPGYALSASPAPSPLHSPPPSSPTIDRRLQPAPPQPRRSLYEDPSDQAWSAPASSQSLAAMTSAPRVSSAHQFYNSAISAQVRPLNEPTSYHRQSTAPYGTPSVNQHHLPASYSQASHAAHELSPALRPNFSMAGMASTTSVATVAPSRASMYTNSIYGGR